MQRFGSLVSLVLASEEQAEDFINGCVLMQASTSFGSVHTSAERRTKRGDAVAPGFVRVSIGCEPVEELWAAMEASLNGLRPA
jgi:cystathionine gamma-lyase